MTLVLSVLVSLAVVALLVQLLGQFAVFWLVGRSSVSASPEESGVTVLKPLKGADLDLERNLRSIFEQDWPMLQLVLGAEDPQDPALAVARRVAANYPGIQSVVVTLPSVVGLNPKVNLCAELAQRAVHDIVVISDASVFAPKDYVRSMLRCFGLPNTGLVSSPLVGFGETTTGGALDNLALNLLVLRAVCFTKLFFRHSCVIGKSMMFRLSVLRQIGGWGVVANVLAEDYVLGRAFKQAGLEVRLCPERLLTKTHCTGLKDGVGRHLRWCQMRRRTSQVAYLAELLSNVFVWAGLLMLVAMIGSEAAESAFSAGALLLGAKFIIDVTSLLWLAPRHVSPSLVLWVPLADVLNFGVWLAGVVKRTVAWRGKRFVIGDQTKLSAFVERPMEEAGATYSAAHP